MGNHNLMSQNSRKQINETSKIGSIDKSKGF